LGRNRMMNRILDIAMKTLLGLLMALMLLYCGDWGVMLHRIANHGDAFGTVMVHSVVTSSLKSGNYDIYGQPPVETPCVHAIFPHQGFTPCWYLAKHAEQVTAY
jgi:hypothetical protein